MTGEGFFVMALMMAVGVVFGMAVGVLLAMRMSLNDGGKAIPQPHQPPKGGSRADEGRCGGTGIDPRTHHWQTGEPLCLAPHPQWPKAIECLRVKGHDGLHANCADRWDDDGRFYQVRKGTLGISFRAERDKLDAFVGHPNQRRNDNGTQRIRDDASRSGQDSGRL